MSGNILRLKPLEFAHILNLNTNITYVELGPKTLILQDNQVLDYGPASLVIIPPGHYCIVQNPAKLPVPPGTQAQLKFSQEEMRFHQEPFPLYPGEILKSMVNAPKKDYKHAIVPLPVVYAGHAIHLKALSDFDDGGVQRTADDEWLIEGPHTYYPRPEVLVVGFVAPQVIAYGYALRLRAKRDLVDKTGKRRVTAEEWMIRKEGAYLPGAYEEVLGMEHGYTLTMQTALHMKADKTLADALGKPRCAGEEWLVTIDDTSMYIPEVGEQVINVIGLTILKLQEYCVVLDPLDAHGKPQLGKRELRKGLFSFFLKPGERLENDIEKAHLLLNDEALILCAKDRFTDNSGPEPVFRRAGDVWMLYGPHVYIPPVEVEIKERRKPISLDKNEGIYVQDQKTGHVRTEMGPQAYLLKETEALWKKQLSPIVESMLQHGGCYGDGDIRKIAYFESSVDPVYQSGKRDKTRVVTYRVPHNTAVQVYDHLKQEARVIFGPNMVILGPAEEFNVLSLSAGKPKKENALKSLALMLGPDYITDVIEVETLDHARLRIKYAANNKFEYTLGDKESEKTLFSVPDFIGFACRNIASRIRGRVAHTSFDEFHRYSTRVVKEAVFGLAGDGKELKNMLKFPENNLIITNIDVQSIEPVDTQMRDSLLKSVQLAIEIATHSIERAAAHEAARNEQTAKGSLERNKLTNEKAAEEARRHLYELRAITAAVESSGSAKAEAEAQAEKSLIEGKMAIEAASLKSQAEEIEAGAKLKSLQLQRHAEIEFTKTLNALEVYKAKKLSEIETGKASSMISAIGSHTVAQIAAAGPLSKIRMLEALGIRQTLITDGKTPLNLYQGGANMMNLQSL